MDMELMRSYVTTTGCSDEHLFAVDYGQNRGLSRFFAINPSFPLRSLRLRAFAVRFSGSSISYPADS